MLLRELPAIYFLIYRTLRTSTNPLRMFRNRTIHAGFGLDISNWAKTPAGNPAKEILQHTKDLRLSDHIPAVDAHHLHLWEARRSFLRRWKGHRHNKRLRTRIALLNKEAAEYAAQHCRQKWLEMWDALQGRLSTSRTWQILRYLIDPTKSRSVASNTTQATIHQFPGTQEDLVWELRARYIPPTPRV